MASRRTAGQSLCTSSRRGDGRWVRRFCRACSPQRSATERSRDPIPPVGATVKVCRTSRPTSMPSWSRLWRRVSWRRSASSMTGTRRGSPHVSRAGAATRTWWMTRSRTASQPSGGKRRVAWRGRRGCLALGDRHPPAGLAAARAADGLACADRDASLTGTREPEPSAEERVLLGIEYGGLATALDRLSPELRSVVQAKSSTASAAARPPNSSGCRSTPCKSRLRRAKVQLRADVAGGIPDQWHADEATCATTRPADSDAGHRLARGAPDPLRDAGRC